MKTYNIVMEDAIYAMNQWGKIAHSTFDANEEIALIKMNPCLNFLQKRKLIKIIKKANIK